MVIKPPPTLQIMSTPMNIYMKCIAIDDFTPSEASNIQTVKITIITSFHVLYSTDDREYFSDHGGMTFQDLIYLW